MNSTRIYKSILITALFFFSVVFGVSAQSSTIDDLRSKIDDRANKIEALEEEISVYEQELEVVGQEKNTLQNAIRSLDLSQNKISTEKNITENRISATTFQISKLALEVNDKERRINLHNDSIAQSIRSINEIDNTTFVEVMLSSSDLSEFWEQVEELQRFQGSLQASVAELKNLKDELIVAKTDQESRRRELINFGEELSDQERAITVTKTEKNSLLNQTKNKESNYLSLLEEKKAARVEFEQELLDFESQLQIAIDPNSIPSARKGILSSPVENPRLTQRFGNTAFAQSGAYNGKGHNGIDFGMPIGTRVKATLNGTVTATGNTDAIPGCYSYGKWVLLKHNNGLSTLYAHLSDISVQKGSTLVTGQTIGFSGNTGYSTGPHLHLSLFATHRC